MYNPTGVGDAEFKTKVKASADPAALGPQDVVISTLKATGVASLATGLQPLLGDDTSIAQWNSGHVAYVDEVGNGFIVTSDDDYGFNNTSRKTISPGESYPAWPDNFIHFGGIATPRGLYEFTSWVDTAGSLRLSHWTGTVWQNDNFGVAVAPGTSPSSFLQ